MSATWNYSKPDPLTSDVRCQVFYLQNIDISLRRIAASLENGEKVKQLDAALDKTEGEIQRLMAELRATKEDLAKVERKAAHCEARANALAARNTLAEVKVIDLRMELAKNLSGNVFMEATDPILDALKGQVTK